jgi:hypothetical protein
MALRANPGIGAGTLTWRAAFIEAGDLRAVEALTCSPETDPGKNESLTTPCRGWEDSR